ncbi:hypothetical protein RchiOBHm_Chr2g0168691 [Rosa chinensis]|uniref:Uncharacterized protein n=1 Tax=Rosa chinensis TaxID=74649 RepID=A0A2P6S4N9_ROSCH|nr:hypothetical protein RchiOBHm_Chr2g0168691 [Rosa chinensis]
MMSNHDQHANLRRTKTTNDEQARSLTPRTTVVRYTLSPTIIPLSHILVSCNSTFN